MHHLDPLNDAEFVRLLAQANEAGLLDEMLRSHPEIARVIGADWALLQRPDQRTPPGDWVTWLILAGRGAGKTRTGAEWINGLAATGLYPSIALVAETAADVRDVMMDGPSGIMHTGHPDSRPKYRTSRRKVEWPNGTIAQTYSADDPEQLRGPQFHAAWSDELAKWRYADEAWSNLQFGLRLGQNPRQTVTTTPRPMKLIREMIIESRKKHPSVVLTRASTSANMVNLAPSFLKTVVAKYVGTRLGRQELEAEILDDNPYALWKRDTIDKYRVPGVNRELTRIVVSVDPPTTSGEDADECGIIVAGCTAGFGNDRHYFVLDDMTTQGMRPMRDSVDDDLGWADIAINAWKLHHADCIVAEVNNGGEMVTQTITRASGGTAIAVRSVRATRGKVTRAEPISALYAQGKVHHVGTFAKLEDQMTEFSSDFDKKTAGYSPDRVDGLVWALTELSGSNWETIDDRVGAVGPRQQGEG